MSQPQVVTAVQRGTALAWGRTASVAGCSAVQGHGGWRALGWRSMMVLLCIGLAMVPAAAQSYTFAGHVYAGHPPDMSEPVAGVRVELFGSHEAWSSHNPGELLAATVTDDQGAFTLTHARRAITHSYFHIVEENPSGTYSTGAQAGRGGYVVNNDVVSYVRAPPGAYAGIKFWDARSLLSAPPVSMPPTTVVEKSEEHVQESVQVTRVVTTRDDGVPEEALPHTLLIGDFVLLVERYDTEGEANQNALPARQTRLPQPGHLEHLAGTAWLSFDCSAASIVPGLLPFLRHHVFDVVLIVTDPARQITLHDARLIEPEIRLGGQLRLQLAAERDDPQSIIAAKDQLIQEIGLGELPVRGDARVRFEAARVQLVPDHEGVGRIVEGVAFYPTEPRYPDIIRLALDGFTAVIDQLTLTPTGATANVLLELPESIAAEDTCERASLPLGEIAITPHCEFYAEKPTDPFGPWIVGETGLVAGGTGYIVDFSSSQSPPGKLPSWKGVLLLEGTGAGSALLATSNTGYLSGVYRFVNAEVLGSGFAGVFDLVESPLTFSPLQPWGYRVTLHGATLEVSASRIVSGQLGPGYVELPVRAVCRDGRPGQHVTATFSGLAVQQDLSIGGEVAFGAAARMGWGELTRTGEELVPWVMEIENGYLYLPASPVATFTPDTGSSFLEVALPTHSVEAAVAALASLHMSGVTISSAGMGMLAIHSPDGPYGTASPLRMENVQGWLRIGGDGVDGELRIHRLNHRFNLGNPARYGYVGGESFRATLMSGFADPVVTHLMPQDEAPLRLQYAASAVYGSEIHGELWIPEPCSIEHLAFSYMEATSTAHLVGGDIVLPEDGVTLEYWDLGFEPTGDAAQAGVISVRTGRLIFTAAGISEYVHFDRVFSLTWCEMRADGNLGELFLDYNAYGQRFDKLPFSAHQLRLSDPIAGLSGLEARAYLAVCGDVHLNYFGSAYVNINDARPDNVDEPFYTRYVTVPKLGEAGSEPTDLHLAGSIDGANGELLALLDFPDASMDYNEVAQQGFLGKGSTSIAFLGLNNPLSAVIEIRPDPISEEPVIDICLSSYTTHDVDFGLFARLTSLGEITGCIRIEGPLLKRIAIGGYMEQSATARMGILAPKAGYMVEVNICVTPNSAVFYAGGDLLLAVGGSAVDVSGSLFLAVDYTRDSVEGHVFGRIDCNSMVAGLEGEGQLTWYIDPQAQYVQGKLRIALCSWIGGLGLEGGLFLGQNAPRAKAWVLDSASEHFGVGNTIPEGARLTGLYGYGQLSESVQLYAFGGGYKLYLGMGAFLPSPTSTLPQIVGSGGVHVNGEVLGGLISASAWARMALYGPTPLFFFEGSFGVRGCVLWVICSSVTVTAGFNDGGFYVY